MIVWKLPMFQQLWHSCGPAWTWGFHDSSSSSFLHYHKNSWALSLDHYFLAGHAQSHLTLGWNTGCGDSEGCSMPYHKNVCRGYHRGGLEGSGEKSNTWRQNWPWIYATHCDIYTPTVNSRISNNWARCNGDLECSGCFGATSLRGWSTVYEGGWRWALCTIMVLFHHFGSSTPCHTHITYRRIQPSSSVCSYQVYYHQNSTLGMGDVGYLVGWAALLVGYLGDSILTIGVAGRWITFGWLQVLDYKWCLQGLLVFQVPVYCSYLM